MVLEWCDNSSDFSDTDKWWLLAISFIRWCIQSDSSDSNKVLLITSSDLPGDDSPIKIGYRLFGFAIVKKWLELFLVEFRISSLGSSLA